MLSCSHIGVLELCLDRLQMQLHRFGPLPQIAHQLSNNKWRWTEDGGAGGGSGLAFFGGRRQEISEKYCEKKKTKQKSNTRRQRLVKNGIHGKSYFKQNQHTTEGSNLPGPDKTRKMNSPRRRYPSGGRGYISELYGGTLVK